MDPFKLLKKDHRKVSQLFKQIESASNAGTKAQLFTQLKSELDVHAHIEETLLYPALENKEKSREITLEAYEEHKVVKDLLAELATRSPDDEWDAKLTVLKENVEHHVEEEEGDLFDKAQDVLSEDQIERLGIEMEAEKAAQSNGGPPAKNAPARKLSTRSGASRKTESPSVLKRLANFVGLGDISSEPNRPSATKKAATKKQPAKKSGAVAKKTTKKAAKKSPAKTATKAAAKSATKRKQPAAKKSGKAAAGSSKKTAKKSASKKK